MQNALGFSRGSRSVKDKQRVLRAHNFRFAIGRDIVARFPMPEEIPAPSHGDVRPGAFNHKDETHIGAGLIERFVHIGF